MILHRRDLIRGGLAAAGAGLAGIGSPAFALALAQKPARKLAVHNLHTGESLSAVYWENGAYVPDALSAMNHVLRDHRTGEAHVIAPTLLDLLTVLSAKVETRQPFEIISGYRSPATNAALHARSAGVASNSLHMKGEAADVRVAGVPLTHLHDTALAMKLGGVGFYPTSDFVHVDVGRVRRWQGV